LKQAPTVWHGLQQISPQFLDEEGLVHSLFSSIADSVFFVWILTAVLPIEEKWMTTKEQ